jgi:hypothetical protein
MVFASAMIRTAHKTAEFASHLVIMTFGMDSLSFMAFQISVTWEGTELRRISLSHYQELSGVGALVGLAKVSRHAPRFACKSGAGPLNRQAVAAALAFQGIDKKSRAVAARYHFGGSSFGRLWFATRTRGLSSKCRASVQIFLFDESRS